MDIRVVSRYVGIALIFNAVLMFVSAGVAAYYSFDRGFSPLLVSAIITFLVGYFPLIFVHERSKVRMKEGILIVVLSWLLCCLFGMLPYVLFGGEFSVVNAWFESVSGYTTSGGSILQDIEDLPHSIIFWRSSTHLVGGIGVVVFMLLMLPSMDSYRQITNLEISGLSKDTYSNKNREIVKIRVFTYFALIAVLAVLLILAGMPLFDSVNVAFSTIATGGFAVTNTSIAAYDSPLIEIIISVFMVIASLHFGLIFLAVTGKSAKLFRSPITGMFLWSILIGGLTVSVSVAASGLEGGLGRSFRAGFFQTISMVSGTGFATADTSVWPLFTIIILSYLMLQGGCAGSTTGAVKVDRILILAASIKAQLRKYVTPDAVVPVKVGGKPVEGRMVTDVALFFALYLAMVTLFALIYSAFGMDITDSLSASLSHMGNVGPAFGSLGSASNFSAVPSIAKFLMGIEMLIGRVEIFPFLMIFTALRR